jgi:hypothetical protein
MKEYSYTVVFECMAEGVFKSLFQPFQKSLPTDAPRTKPARWRVMPSVGFNKSISKLDLPGVEHT